MNFKSLFFILSLLASLSLHAQLYKFSGFVIDGSKSPLPLATVEVKEVQKGMITDEDGSFEFFLETGNYSMVISMVGFETKVVTFVINNADSSGIVVLDLDKSANLSEVVIKVKSRDRAEEIVRNVIRRKETIQSAQGSYSCDLYIKASQQDSLDVRKKKKEGDLPNPGLAYKGMSLAEIYLRVNKNSQGQVREETMGIKKIGRVESLFYLSATDGDFNVYNNFIKAPAVSTIPFISPVSFSGLVAYRYKTLKIERVGGHKIYTIAVRPRQLSNATVEGTLVIDDSLWAVLNAQYRLPAAHTPEYDFFEVNLQYRQRGESGWMLERQQFNYHTRIKGGRRYGQTLVAISNYEFNKNFPKGYFGAEVSTTTMEAYERDSTFWSRIRSEPLTEKEFLYSRYQDSLYKVMHTEAYLDSLDRITNKVSWKKLLLFGQIFNNHRKERSWIIPPLPFFYQPFQFGGGRLNLAASYKRVFPSRKNISVDLKTSYGFRNHDINGSVTVKSKYNPINAANVGLTVGRDFQYIFDGDAWINLLKRSNIYLNNSVELAHGIGVTKNLYVSNTFEIAFRRSVSNYRLNPKADSLFGGILADDGPVPFEPYNAVYGKIRLEYTPGHRYRREPREKISLGSKWPTFYVQWRKGIPGSI